MPPRYIINDVLNPNNNIITLLGKAGTGKSTSIKFLLDSIDTENLNIDLVSLTGKASSVIGTITGREGKTIHRLASAKFNKLPDFEKGSNNKLNSDVVIIDELGMLDMMTFASLLTALKDDVKIIMLGDINQLNPIQSNNIISLMKNIIDKNISKSIKITELKNNYRSEDVINKLAMMVLYKKSNEFIY